MKKIFFGALAATLGITNVFAQQGENMPTAQEIIEALDLKPLPEEGGYYRETYRSDGPSLAARTLGIDAEGTRTLNTAIYYLVKPESFSALHRIKTDEIFHFYAGSEVEMIQLDEAGKLTRITIGPNILEGQLPQVVVPRGVWQGLRLKEGGQWALMGTTVAPGFEFQDFEVGIRDSLIKQFPQHREDITRFTRGENEKAH
jgi:predicted cupin superfamily sugar epimerase